MTEELTDDAVTSLRRALRRWFARHARDLPWRRTRDPYAVWVSEVMLQQTRVETVIPYYARFLARFATVGDLAAADESDVLTLWSGLGYYRRAKLLHAGARAVVARHGGVIPGDWNALRALPGVGDYTAGALGSIAFGLRVPLVDGNVERVLTRIGAIAGDPRGAAGKKRVWALARRLSDDDDPGALNQALMELGATVCTPTSPQCLTCPARAECRAVALGDPTRFPEKPARAEARAEDWVALVATHRDAVWLVESDLGRWGGMLLPPMARGVDASALASPGVGAMTDRGVVVHVLTHARMSIRVFAADLAAEPARGRLVRHDALGSHAVPKVTHRVLQRARDA